MAAEGFLFAKLPKSFLMPQLRYWLMYRKGIVITDKEKSKSNLFLYTDIRYINYYLQCTIFREIIT